MRYSSAYIPNKVPDDLLSELLQYQVASFCKNVSACYLLVYSWGTSISAILTFHLKLFLIVVPFLGLFIANLCKKSLSKISLNITYDQSMKSVEGVASPLLVICKQINHRRRLKVGTANS